MEGPVGREFDQSDTVFTHQRRLPAQQRCMRVEDPAAPGIDGNPVQQHLDTPAGDFATALDPDRRSPGDQTIQDRSHHIPLAGAHLISAENHSGIGESDLSDGELGDRALIGFRTAITFVERLVTRGFRRPGARVETGHHRIDSHITPGGAVHPADRSDHGDVLDRMTYGLGLEGRIQRDHDATHRISRRQPAQQRQQIGPQRAGGTTVREFVHTCRLPPVQQDAAANHTLVQCAQVVPDDGGSGLVTQAPRDVLHTVRDRSRKTRQQYDGRAAVGM